MIKNKLNFDLGKNIIDNNSIYNKIKQITNNTKLRNIENFLKGEFSDFKLRENVTIEDFENFKNKYKEACINNYSRINFFGLSIPYTKKPREVELYSLFVKPNFKRESNIIYRVERLRSISKQTYYKAKSEDESLAQLTIEEEEVINALQKISEDSFLEFSKNISISKEKIKRTNIGRFTNEFSNENIPFDYLFSFGNHTVLLGNPGAGKSSLVKYAICKIIEGDQDVFNDKNIYGYLPYRIELHKYNQLKKQLGNGILNYIKFNLIQEFQIDISVDVLNEIVEKFPCLIFFDGLDEIFDINERQQVRSDIENFVIQNPLIKSIVTSRYESYEEVRLRSNLYRVLSVKDFNDNQVKEYVERWYKIEEANDLIREQEVKDCLEQLANVDKQLKHNPLLLALILILYRNEKDLPTSKLAIYEGCARTLVETRDEKEKKLNLKLLVRNKISVFANLAYWQFNNEITKKDFKLDYRSLIHHLSDYLLIRGEFDDWNDAEEAAKQFVDYAQLRSIYVENKFTHKTFYEYFISHYIFSNIFLPHGHYDEFLELLLNNIGYSTWSVVLELLICQIDSALTEYKVLDDIITYLLSRKLYETCHFFASILPYLQNVSRNKLKDIIGSIVYFVCSLNNESKYRFIITEKLVELLKIKRFQDVFNFIVEAKLEEGNKESEAVFCLLLELSGYCNENINNTLLIKYHDTLCRDDEKYAIITNIQGIQDKSKNWSLFMNFFKNFGKKAALKTYSSNYHLECFGKSYYFNWIYTLLVGIRTKEQLTTFENRLSEIGITKDDIMSLIINESEDAFDYLVIALFENKTLKSRNIYISEIYQRIFSKHKPRLI